MSRRSIPLGGMGEVQLTPQMLDDRGKWKTHPTGKGKAVARWRARVSYRRQDGAKEEITRVAPKRAEAEANLRAAVELRLRSGDGVIRRDTPLLEAGEAWLALCERPDSGKSTRTVADYKGTWRRYFQTSDSRLRGLSLTQANDPQQVRLFLQDVADRHGTSAAKMARSVLSGILTQAVNDGVLTSNATRQVRPVKARSVRPTERDRTRALTREERDALLAYADDIAQSQRHILRSQRKWQTAADLLAFMLGTGVRIGEARALRWEHVDLTSRQVRLHGTKSKAARRRLTMPQWLAERMAGRAATFGATGYAFASPSAGDPERPWDQSASSKAVRALLDGSGFSWAVPHTFRRSVATLLDAAGVPTVRVADQLGHKDPSMTSRVYLGRDFEGDKSDLAEHL